MRTSSTRRRTAWVVLAMLVLVGSLADPTMAAGGAKEPRPTTLATLADRLGVSAQNPLPCGWMIDVSAKTLNVAALDTHTNYFVQPYYLQQGQEIVVHGEYPYSRYFSFIAYGNDGLPINGVSIHDEQIDPDPGSDNPFSTADPPPDTGREYTIHVTASQPEDGTKNTIAGLNAGVTQGFGFLLYRIYLPDDSRDPAAGVPLPTITTASGTHRTCSRGERAVFNKLFAPVADALVAEGALCTTARFEAGGADACSSGS